MSDLRFCDVYTFAAGFSLGAVQAGFEMIAKREGSGGFGVPAAISNRHLLGQGWEVECCEAKDWSVSYADVIYSNPPCSGFSLRSIHVPIKGTDKKNSKVSDWTNGFRGVNSSVNSCMHDVVEYAARCPQLQACVFESVPQAGRLGLPLMRDLRVKLETLTGKEWDLHHVFHNNLSVGGTCDRPRYFWVASRMPFAVVPPRPRKPPPCSSDVLRDPEGVPLGDGRREPTTKEARRVRSLLEQYVVWPGGEVLSQAAKRYVDTHGLDALRALDAWDSPRLEYFVRREFRPDQYQPRRWRADRPCPVISGKLQESIHPTEPRCLTLREGARVLGYPEEWTLSAYKNDSWLGKGIPIKSGKWIAESVKLSLEGRTGDLVPGTLVGDREWKHDNTNAWKK